MRNYTVATFSGTRMRQARERLGLSQDELAVATGRKQQEIGRWETGKIEPSTTALSDLADALETTTDYLLMRSEALGDDAEKQALTPELRKLVWLVGRGLHIEAIELLTGIAQGKHET